MTVLWGIYGVGDIFAHTKPLQILLIRVLCHKQASPLDALLFVLLYSTFTWRGLKPGRGLRLVVFDKVVLVSAFR